MVNLTSDRRPGRPRKYATNAERARVFRAVHGLRKITVDVPVRCAGRLRAYARELRRMEIGTPNGLTPKQAAESYVMNMRWTRVARGVHFLHGVDPFNYGLTAEVTEPPQNNDSAPLWSWQIDDKQKNIVAHGCSISLKAAKEIAIAVVQSHLENDQSFYVLFAHPENW